MHLLIIGSLGGHISAAMKMALDNGARVSHVDNVNNALRSLREGEGAELVMIDAALDVGALVQGLERERISVPVVACGLGTDAEEAVAAIKSGAREYVPLPPDPELIAAVFAAVSADDHRIIYQDTPMTDLLRLADQVAASDASILITGESGTGKELIAHYLHGKSPRADRKFVSINCAAIPDNLLESELFGHEKGAFTGAIARRIGKFEEANGGTLLLDEVSEMDPRLQAKLLRAIQEREIDRLGGTQPVKVDIRLLATSNRNLEEEVRAGNFREDLYFRLNVVTLRLPALRERRKDIPLLATHFAEKYAAANGMPARPIATAAMERLTAHDWPGNVRELENTLHRAVLLSSGEAIEPAAIVLNHQGLQKGSSQADQGEGNDAFVGRTVADVERQLILQTLEHCLGNRTHAANILGISIRTLRNKLKQYDAEGIAVPPHEQERAAV